MSHESRPGERTGSAGPARSAIPAAWVEKLQFAAEPTAGATRLATATASRG